MSLLDVEFWDALIERADYPELEWLEIRIRRRKESLKSRITASKIIIRKK